MADVSDSEDSQLMSQGRDKQQPDWNRFGLSREQQKTTQRSPQDVEHLEAGYQHSDDGKHNELFREDQNVSQKPWWKANFFISEPVLFGTWDGVFTTCVITLLGVVIFLRMGWMVGNAGIGLSIVIVLVSVAVALTTALSAIGVCERCRMESGGVYFLMSHVMGGRIGGSLGIVYCFAQAVSCSLSVMGFGESIMGLIKADNPWIARGIAMGLVALLLCINIAGVKWVIRLQLLLLALLFLSMVDFFVGSFVHTDSAEGVTGYSAFNFHNNSGPEFLEGESFFTMFGLFFSTVTGILAGINMSGDLQDPFKNIPTGTLSSLGAATFLYLSFIIVLGATCTRYYLLNDYMITEKVSIIGVMWLAGLYISSISSCMSSLYGPPRILQSIANENVIPIIKILGQGRGPNKVPIYALVVVTLVVVLFILIGDVNTLAPIVTTAFMMTYTVVDYSYFALAMSYDKRKDRDARFEPQDKSKASPVNGELVRPLPGYGATNISGSAPRNKDSFEKIANDLDKLFPERLTHRGQLLVRQESAASAGTPVTPDADFDATKRRYSSDTVASEPTDEAQLLTDKSATASKKPNTEITKQPRSWYSVFCNRWVSLVGAVVCIVIMFTIQWAYALAELTVTIIVYIYIGQASPGYFPGIAEFNFYDWVKESIKRCCRRGPHPPEHIVVTQKTPAVSTLAAQLTEDNEDFANRGRYHQSKIIEGDNFDDYDSE